MAENIIIGESYKQPSENDGEVIENGGQYKFDGEAQTAAYAPYPLSVKANNPQGEVFVTGTTFECDTREKLEADVRDLIERNFPWHGIVNSLFTDACLWLDRQAAITERTHAVDNLAIEELRKQIDELTAERDRLREQLAEECDTCEPANAMQAEITRLREAVDALESGTMWAKYREVCEERDNLQRVVRIQADSFKDMERELAQARKGLDG